MSVGGVSLQAAGVGVLAVVAVVVALARAIARRSDRRDRTLVSLNARE
jgi:hypothetical protein